MLHFLLPVLALAPLLPGGMRSYRSKEAIIKSNAPAAEAKALGKRLDHYCELFKEFYDEVGLKKKNDNTLKIRLFATYDEYEEYYKRGGAGLGGTPLAYFSPSLNSIVMYSDEEDVALRAVVFHEASHQYLNRYTYDAPKWINEGLAEYFEGWKVPEKGPATRRAHLYDVALVQKAIKDDKYLEPRKLIEMGASDFNDFAKNNRDLHSYMHYATSWSLVYYCLSVDREGDQERMLNYLNDLRSKGANAEFEVDDWDAFTERWKAGILRVDPTPTDAVDYFLIAQGYRSNKEWSKSVAALEKALEADPALPSARYWLGYSHKRTGNYTKAKEVLKQVMIDSPEDPRAPYNLARMYLGIDRESDESEAEIALEYALKASDLVDDESPLYLWLISRCYIELGDKKKAVRFAKKILKVIDKEDREVWEPTVEALREQAK